MLEMEHFPKVVEDIIKKALQTINLQRFLV